MRGEVQGECEIVEKMYFNGLLDFVYVELMKGLQKEFVPKRCANCRRWFLQTPGATYSYCNEPAPGQGGKTCREIGAAKSFKEKVDNNDIWKVHQRAYKKYFARVSKGKMSKPEFEVWAREAERMRDEALAEDEVAKDKAAHEQIVRRLTEELKFTAQSQGMLIDWLIRRFSAAGKSIELEAAQRLIFISGDLMSRLIPEIEKVAAYAKGDRVTVADVEVVANHIPEAVVFDMTDYIAQKKYNTAMAVLAELISDKNNAPIAMVAMIGQQMRRLYGAKLASAQPDGMKALMDACGIKYEFIAKKLIASARGFTLPQLVRAVELCADADYKMKSSSTDDTELLKELVLRIAAGEADA